MQSVVLFGMPREIGGGCTEAGDTALLWRKMGIPITVIPEGPGVPDNTWPESLGEAGCVIRPEIATENLNQQPWLIGSTVVDFACRRAAQSWDQLARMGCKLIHVPCHCYTMPHEHDAFRHRPPTAVVFQSAYQKSCLSLQYSHYGVPVDRQVLIHGAFDAAAFPFRPRTRHHGEPFVVGRLARAEPFKYPPAMWDALTLVRQLGIPCIARCMGWKPNCGVAPEWWAEYLPEGAESSRAFLAKCHALLCMNLKGTCENWSRVVLEAFSAGVPVVADARGGYVEQIEHERTGLLCETPVDFADAITRLENNEDFRQKIVRNARESLGTLADPTTIGTAWKTIFEILTYST